jgi:hypothetical protein
MAIRYRRNINCLTTNQLHDFRESMQALFDLPESSGDSFATLGGLHGLPSPTWCDHGAPGFLTWHRAYMRAFERALQCVNSDVMLPFWDWSSTNTIGLPAACSQPTYVNRDGDTVSNPLYSGPIAAGAGGGTTARGSGVDSQSFAGPATSAQASMASGTFASFQSALNGPHGSVHGLIGGEMGSVPRAGFDPIFYLHHCNVDRLWRNWQQTNLSAVIPASEANHPLDPFNKPFSDEWYDGADMLSTDDLGYRYSNWCFWLPPVLVWEVLVVKFDPWIIRRMREAKLIFRADRMSRESIEFRVFINQPGAGIETELEDNSSFAGSIGTFGMGDMEMESRSTSRTFDLELNITECLRTCVNEGDEEATLKVLALSVDGEAIDSARLDTLGIDLEID